MSDKKTTKQSLFAEFPPVSTEEWEKIIKQDLKGADYKEKLRWETGEGVKVLPFYRREDFADINRQAPLAKKYSDSTPNSWEIRERVFGRTIKTARDSAQNALTRGADALQYTLRVRRTEGMLGGDLQGLPIQNQQDFAEMVRGISLETTPLHFDAGLASPAILSMLWNEVRQQGLNNAKIRATFFFDPFVYILQHGHYPKDEEVLRGDIRQLARFTTRHLPNVRPLCIDARTYHNTGATVVQQLGFALAAASEYLSILTGISDADDVANTIHFNFSTGSKYFPEIAKFRAARILWKNLLDAYGFDGDTMIEAYIQGDTSNRNKTLYDPYTNLLRTSTEGMSAAIAGCDAVTILPFDQHFRSPDDFSERLARNQQIILSEEAYLDKVRDPAAGSYYIEELTDKFGEKAWKLFQDIESEGGLLKAIENGTVQTAIQRSREDRERALATGERVLVGTNKYCNTGEKMGDHVDSTYQSVSLNESEQEFDLDFKNLPEDLASVFAEGAEMGDVVPQLFDEGRHHIRTVTPYRLSRPFEELRLATENHERTPTVLTLPLGDRRWRKGRSTFTANFFGCVGYKIIEPIGFEDVDAAVNAVKEQQPDIAVICSSDKEYRKLVPAIGKALKKWNQRPILVLAGNPKGEAEGYRQAGVDEFIHKKSNVLDILTRFQKKLNVIKP